MSQLSTEDIKKLATLSALKLDEQEVQLLTKQIGSILEYVAQISMVDTQGRSSIRLTNQNIFREDVAIQQSTDALLAQAPQRKDNYFVVPQILEQNKQ
jgi:aspartyl-tRNA(Asn)/glutamyl-tRNA(Gln) amidotransferase subunit C